ncbi:MAG: alpha/beta fold hydrolase [Bacillota bacterium]|nr:alpha/beta hydrolase [Bacillota bacterium]
MNGEPGRTRTPWRRRLLWGALVAVLAVAGSAVGVSLYVGWQLTHPVRKALTGTLADAGLAYEAITFPSVGDEEPLTLRGWYLAARANGAKPKPGVIVFAHGYRQNRLQEDVPALALARDLVRAGYDVLLFDFRNSGQSPGRLTTVGILEQRDLLGAVRYARERRPDARVGLLGFSMGAATAIQVAAASPDVAAVVADSPFADLKAYLRENLSVWSGLPHSPFTPLILSLIPPLIGADPEAMSPVRAVAAFDGRPLLLIHGTADTKIPLADSRAIARQAQGHAEVELWTVEGADHVKAYARDPAVYTKKVLAFFDQHLGSSRSY